MKGYTGISFPFRLGNRGGLVMSTTSRYDVAHITESMEQLLGTNLGERVMEMEIGSDIDTQIFEMNDVTTHNIIKYQIVETLAKFEPRIEVFMEDIEIEQEDNKIFANIKFRVLSYQSDHNTRVYIGGVENDREKYRL